MIAAVLWMLEDESMAFEEPDFKINFFQDLDLHILG